MGGIPLPTGVAEASVKEMREEAPPAKSSVKGSQEGMEKLVVEFDVEKTIDRGYGIQEKYLMFRGERTKYKGIVKDGQLVAIVSRGYTVVPNRQVVEVLRKHANGKLGELEKWGDDVRMTYIIPIAGDMGILVENSEDATMTLNVCLAWRGIPVKAGIIRFFEKRIKVVRRKHVGKVGVSLVDEAIQYLKEIAGDIGNELAKVLDMPITADIMEIIEKVEIPKKYMYPSISVGAKGKVGDWFGEVSRRIWSCKKIKANVRHHYLRRLADALTAIVLAKI